MLTQMKNDRKCVGNFLDEVLSASDKNFLSGG